jgi:transcriptional regulator with XRE-family HTH domain
VAESPASRRATADTRPSAEEASSGHLLELPRGGPTVLRIVLGSHLRRLREQHDISTEQAGYAIRASHSKISRLELGRVGFKERDVADLLTLYGVTDVTERDMLLSLAEQANTPGWWHQYGDVLPSWFEVYIGLEEAASLIRTYEVQFVPGLLQTEDYARAVIRLGHPEAIHAEIERRVRVRMTRRLCLTSAEPPRLWAIVDEAVLRRPIGGARVMRAQLEHLIEMSRLDNVTLQIVPFHAGGHAAAGGPFAILRFAEQALSDVVYLEQLTSALYLDKPADIDKYLRTMNRLSVEAARPEDTEKFLTALLRQL